ncbi:pentapeptide repeat-containing protein [Cyclobacterium sp. 1_MG-2023]|uniref:pentapeptide repeat-containing protein n=1 Tax=Cyclobacterium sp. 1_MG-2023 TaxID=3062681 RepID=UPI0026E16D44|nr:pentapeptide repeat-containing protein [Cyclobacterium sp. 1_MG-2023]MDO6437147.1 pentapeptide repeat-containing protein [Cyclobacterium sp. 1_MG-2023]
MESESFINETFDQVDYSENRMEGEAYEQCLFSNCNFFNSDLCRIEFMDCQFFNCNFSMTSIIDAAFKNVAFQQCKLMGIDFSKCDDFLFSASFTGCTLDYSIFQAKNLKKAKFDHCSLKDVDFSNADLSFAIFDTCNLLQATFYNSILEKADFRTAINYSFDPAYNKIKKAKFSLEGLPGLLSKYNIEVNY